MWALATGYLVQTPALTLTRHVTSPWNLASLNVSILFGKTGTVVVAATWVYCEEPNEMAGRGLNQSLSQVFLVNIIGESRGKVQSEVASRQLWPLRRTLSDDIQLFKKTNFVRLFVCPFIHLFIC